MIIDAENLALQYGMQFIDLEGFSPDSELIARFPSQLLFRETMLPIEQKDGLCVVAIANPLKLDAIDQLHASSPWPVETVLANSDLIKRTLHRCLGLGGGTVQDLVATSNDEAEELCAAASEEIDDKSKASSVIKLVNELIVEAIAQRASDIHIEPEKQDLIVRFRIDGVLHEQSVPNEIQRFRAAIISRIKIMAKLNIAEKRLPQDGRIQLNLKGRELDVRVSIIPTHFGESVVLRLLSGSEAGLSLEKAQLPEPIRKTWNSLIRRAHGLILVTGPTGSGKTTTLYSSLAEIRSPHIKIMTIEDPIEYKLRQISQIQVHSEIGLTFSHGLRSILRHDPDVVLIGEIRDTETAKIAIQASMTGHLVFSTLHTNDAASSITRLVDMGVEPYLVASSLESVMAQRLIRRLCTQCRCAVDRKQLEVPSGVNLVEPETIFKPVGCRACNGTGYAGRQAIFELMINTAKIRELCLQNASADVLQRAAIQDGMQTLRQSAWHLVSTGVTSLDELYRVCPSTDS